MTAAKTAAPSTYVSGFCGVAAHERCRGQYAGCTCTCGCHTTPPPEPEPEPEPELDPEPVLPLLLARHCPTCSCTAHTDREAS